MKRAVLYAQNLPFQLSDSLSFPSISLSLSLIRQRSFASRLSDGLIRSQQPRMDPKDTLAIFLGPSQISSTHPRGYFTGRNPTAEEFQMHFSFMDVSRNPSDQRPVGRRFLEPGISRWFWRSLRNSNCTRDPLGSMLVVAGWPFGGRYAF